MLPFFFYEQREYNLVKSLAAINTYLLIKFAGVSPITQIRDYKYISATTCQKIVRKI